MKAWISRHLQPLLRGLGSLLSLGLLVLLAHEAGWEELLGAFRQIPLGMFALGVGLLVVSRFFVVMRWYVLLRGAGMQVSLRETTVMTFTGLFASNFLPSTIGGDVVRLVGIMRLGYDRAVCLASLAADRLIGMAGFVFTLPLGLLPWLQAGAGTLSMAAVWGRWWERGKRFVLRTFQALSLWLKQPDTLFKALLATWGNMLFLFLSLYTFTHGLGAPMPFWLVAGAWSLTYYVTLIPISINGFGLQELSATYFFTALGGMSVPQALALAVLIRFSFIFASLPGALFLPEALASVSRLEQ